MWDSDDWRDHKEAQKLRKKLNMAKNKQEVSSLCERIGVSIHVITEHHLRLSKANFQSLDYFPITNKVCVFRSNKYIRVKNINAYLKKYFQ